ncbi:MAG: toll/interleukin-1 receptor domain-containing protein [Bacteroidaceae bacterium]|nr:toll/interleukin-1 receptor domain-containing protein [Bacteroidaceae bacterium]
MNNRKYFAFISYKRKGVDEKVANWIDSKLEKYPYPKEYVSEENRPEDDTMIRKIFIDTKELPVTEEKFEDKIKEAIKNSRYLILVCSDMSAESVYVNSEVEYFLQTHNNEVDKILPVFIDTVDEKNLPEVLRNKNILNRNCPIYKSSLETDNEVNLYCFYHIVAFLLKVDFNIIYDRYVAYAKKKRRQKIALRGIFYTMIVALILMLIDIISSQNQIVKLEKEIFPYSVVTGYVENFLSPVIDYIKENELNTHIFVHMPTKSQDIDHNHADRFDKITDMLSLDSISRETLKTRMKRGSTLYKLYSKSNTNIHNTFLDFASTTSTFLAIANKKKEYSIYRKVEIDKMIQEYTDIFIHQANGMLKEDSVYVTFVTSIGDITKVN